MENKKELILKFLEMEVIKIGNFKLKSGILSPIYFDLRILPSYPKILQKVGEEIWKTIENNKNISFQVICGVPYTALPIATVCSINYNIPMLIVRKEKKDYGTKNQVEGIFNKDGTTNCLIIEDVVTTGESVLTVAETLRNVGIQVKHVVVFLDRNQGAKENLLKKEIFLHSVLNIEQLLDILKTYKLIDSNTIRKIEKFFKSNSSSIYNLSLPKKELTYSERINFSKCEISKKLFQIMDNKKTNLAIAIDVTSKKELLELASQLGSEICLLKTHIDIIEDFDQDLVIQLKKIAEKNNFLIFEDRKFADIGYIVKNQYSGGIYKINEWADLSDIHIISGKSTISSLQEIILQDKKSFPKGLLLISQMSTQDNLINNDIIIQNSLNIAHEYSNIICGFICQQRLSNKLEDLGFIYCTPGVHLYENQDHLGQHYNTPEYIIYYQLSDIIIVGRGILASENKLKTAQEYRKQSWLAYQKRINSNNYEKI